MHGFLVLTFAAHLLAFLWLWRTRGIQRYLWLCGTFICLIILFTLKWRMVDPAWAGVRLQVALRVVALAFTAIYLRACWVARRAGATPG